MTSLNLGILAHVDAGETSLTERLLFAAGVIDQVGSVDCGNTQTDSLALERARGITIKAAVVSFGVGDLTVNLIDPPAAKVQPLMTQLPGLTRGEGVLETTFDHYDKVRGEAPRRLRATP